MTSSSICPIAHNNFLKSYFRILRSKILQWPTKLITNQMSFLFIEFNFCPREQRKSNCENHFHMFMLLSAEKLRNSYYYQIIQKKFFNLFFFGIFCDCMLLIRFIIQIRLSQYTTNCLLAFQPALN